MLTGKPHHLLLFGKDLENSTRQKIGEAAKGKTGAHPSLSTESQNLRKPKRSTLATNFDSNYKVFNKNK